MASGRGGELALQSLEFLHRILVIEDHFVLIVRPP